MKIASLADVKANLSAYVRESRNGPVVITRNGKPVAAIVPVATDNSRKLQDVLRAARTRLRRGKGIAHDQFWKSVESGRRGKAKAKGRRKHTLASLLAKAKGPSPHRALDQGRQVGREII